MEKTAVTISRYWGNPQIRVSVTDDSIDIRMSMQDFINAVVKELDIESIKSKLKLEVGSVTFVFTGDEIKSRLYKAIDSIDLPNKIAIACAVVSSKMKEESVKVM